MIWVLKDTALTALGEELKWRFGRFLISGYMMGLSSMPTPFEKKILDEVITPSIVVNGKMHTLNFDSMLKRLKGFYEVAGGKNWYDLLAKQ